MESRYQIATSVTLKELELIDHVADQLKIGRSQLARICLMVAISEHNHGRVSLAPYVIERKPKLPKTKTINEDRLMRIQ